MNWVLLILLASTASSEKIMDTTTIPMKSEELCNTAKEKMISLYKGTQSPHFVIVMECLQTG